MDAFAVSLSSGMCIDGLRFRHAFRGALSFGLFQALMPILGWFVGGAFRSYIQGFDHWIAFGLLAFIGGRMIVESLSAEPPACDDDGDEIAPKDIRNWKTLLVLSFATSVDALAVGLSYSLLGESIWAPAAIIGVVTFAVCLAGFEFGRRVGSLLERRVETLGGVVLIIIGLRILIQHLMGRA